MRRLSLRQKRATLSPVSSRQKQQQQQGWRCLLRNTGVMCYFSVAMKIVYGKLGAIRVVTSQLGFARPFSSGFFLQGKLFQLS